MNFEWDENKNRSNFQKHGIYFDEAKAIFDNPVFTAVDNRNNYGEERKISIGTLEDIVILVVVYTDRKGNRRIISARKTNKKEREIYHEFIQRTLG
jgi:uncharacterized DUF497 family protein